jgi:hypothetical protein
MPAAAIKTAVRVLVIPLEPDNEPYAIIPLHGKYGQGKVAKVSLEDVARVRRYRWYAKPKGYVFSYEARKSPKRTFKVILMHRYILNAPSGVLVDHKYGDKLDNRRSKLRLADSRQNAHNRRRKGSIGIQRAKRGGKWLARIKVDGTNIYLGSYDTKEEAARVYDACARFHFGEFAVCNHPGRQAASYQETRMQAQELQAENWTSLYKGVHWVAQTAKWKARVNLNGVRYDLGSYKDEKEAALAFDSCARYFLGDKAKTNFNGGEILSPYELKRRNYARAFESGERTSRFEGVFAEKSRWRADFMQGGVQIYIGMFDVEEDAARAYDACVLYHLGSDSFTNFSDSEAKNVDSFRAGKTRKGASRYRGVTLRKDIGKWAASIAIKRAKYFLGCFKIEEDAARAYDDARAAHGLPRVNFPDQLEAA